MFLMIHLFQIAQLITNGHFTFKLLSESVAQIMSQKKFLKTPSTKLNKQIWTVASYSHVTPTSAYTPVSAVVTVSVYAFTDSNGSNCNR